MVLLSKWLRGTSVISRQPSTLGFALEVTGVPGLHGQVAIKATPGPRNFHTGGQRKLLIQEGRGGFTGGGDSGASVRRQEERRSPAGRQKRRCMPAEKAVSLGASNHTLTPVPIQELACGTHSQRRCQTAL